jgi:hypothetical protein
MEDSAYLYAMEKYSVAVSALVGVGEITARLKEAYMVILPVGASQLPEHVLDKHKALKQDLTWIPVDEPGEGTITSTLRAVDEAELDRLAKRFFEVYLDIDSAYHDAHGF